MTFVSREVTVDQGTPVTIFLFQHGFNKELLYTNVDKNVVFGGKTYQPASIRHASITSNATLDSSSLELSMAADLEVVKLFTEYPPTTPVTLRIFQGHLNDADNQFLAIWNGRVLSHRIEGSEATLSCEPTYVGNRRVGLRRHWQYSCPHVLYGDQCRASEANGTKTLTVSSVSKRGITLPTGWNGTVATTSFTGGMVEWNNNGNTEIRSIVGVVNGRELRVDGLVRGLATGDTVKVIVGCNRQLSDCRDIHDNVLNFGGAHAIPQINPQSIRNLY